MSEFVYIFVVLLTFVNFALILFLVHGLVKVEESVIERVDQSVEGCHARMDEVFMQLDAVNKYLGIRLRMKGRHYEAEDDEEFEVEEVDE